MNMPYRVLVADGNDCCQTIIDATFAEVDAVYNNWNPSSEVSALNSLPAGLDVQLSPELYQFIVRVGEFVRLTNGLFDPTVAPASSLWKEALRQGELPEPTRLADLRGVIGWEQLSFADGRVRKSSAATAFDFGGVAKGHAVDLLVERLQLAGYSDVYVSWGGEVRTAGAHPDGRPWRVAVRDPRGIGFPPLNIYSLRDQAIATSGDYEQYWIGSDDHVYTHICNPHTLKALQIQEGSIASVTVVAESCALADALATAAMLTGTVEQAEQFARLIEEKLPSTAFFIAGRADSACRTN